MKISTSADHGKNMAGLTPQQSAAIMKKAGFDGVDFELPYDYISKKRPSDEEWTNTLLHEANAIRSEGLEILQFHLPYFPGNVDTLGVLPYDEFEALMLPDYIRALRVCAEIECPIAVMHPYFALDTGAETISGNLRMLEKLMPVMEETHTAIALENVYGCKTESGKIVFLDVPTEHPKILLQIAQRMNSSLVGLCLDTGHANIFRLNIADTVHLYGKHLMALHVNSNAGTDEHCMPNCITTWTEKMDFKAFSHALRDVGYQGSYNLEITHGPAFASVVEPYYTLAAAIAKAFAKEAE